jgi:hypothetical protein
MTGRLGNLLSGASHSRAKRQQPWPNLDPFENV